MRNAADKSVERRTLFRNVTAALPVKTSRPHRAKISPSDCGGLATGIVRFRGFSPHDSRVSLSISGQCRRRSRGRCRGHAGGILAPVFSGIAIGQFARRRAFAEVDFEEGPVLAGRLRRHPARPRACWREAEGRAHRRRASRSAAAILQKCSTAGFSNAALMESLDRSRPGVAMRPNSRNSIAPKAFHPYVFLRREG